MATIKELEDGIKKLNDDFQELKAKKQNNGRWVPGHGEIYYYIGSGLVVDPTKNYNQEYDKNRILVGNCYKTEEDGEKERDRIIAIAEVNQIIREENGDRVIDWNDSGQNKYMLCYNYENEFLETSMLFKQKLPCELDFFSGRARETIMTRITQDQINKIWRL